jgi:hypothetical protein
MIDNGVRLVSKSRGWWSHSMCIVPEEDKARGEGWYYQLEKPDTRWPVMKLPFMKEGIF